MKRRVIVALSAAGLISAGAVVYGVGGGPLAASPDAGAGPGEVHTLALQDMSDGEKAGPQQSVMGLPAKRTQPFSMVGVSWTDPRAVIDGTVQIRARSAGRGAWSPWQSVEAHSDDGPGDKEQSDARARGATAPLWVGPSDGVQVRVAGKGGALPKGLRVELIDPGDGKGRPKPRAAGRQPGTDVALAGAVSTEAPTADPSADPTDTPTDTPATTGSPSPADEVSPTDTATPPQSPTESPSPTSSPSPSGSASSTAPATIASSTAPRPTIVTRAQWGADEKLVTAPAEYAPAVKVVFAHHTAGTNNYTCDQSPAIIRSLLLYHVKTNGWNDIGYNFLVDKCGTIFEGRKGGLDRPVIGAHTYGFNTGSSGISVLGDYTRTAPTQASLSAVAKVAAWKLGLHGGDPTGKAVLSTPIDNGKFKPGQYSFNTVSGHRDGFATECPGQLLYDKLPAIRSEAKQWSSPATSLALSSVTGATKVGTTYYTKGTVTLGWKPAAVSGYEVLVGGTVVARPAGTATSAKITLPAGSHDVRLRATNINGTTVTSPAYRMTVDATAPVFTTPAALRLRAATVTAGGSIPVQLAWKATDNTVLQSVKATSPTAATFSPTTTSWSSYAKNNASTAWSLTAADAAGNTRVSAVTRTGALIHETGSTRTGTWKTSSNSNHLGGRAYYSSARGATASYTFTGRSVGLISTRATSFGAFYVYVDGVKTAFVDTRYSKTVYRQVVWTKTWSTSGKHTIKIVVAGTSGRPTVVTDGIAYIK